MKLTGPSRATLYALRNMVGDLLLMPPDQFVLVGKDEAVASRKKKRQHAGLTVRGTLLNTLEKEIGFSNFQLVADQLRPSEPVSLSDDKIVFSGGSFRAAPEQEVVLLREALKALDGKLNATPVCSFRIGRSEIIRSRKSTGAFLGASPRSALVVRFYKEPIGAPQCELSFIPDRWAGTPGLTHSYSWQLDRFEGDEFAVSMTGELYRVLPVSDYEVTVYSSGVAEWIAMDYRLTFIIEERKPRDERRPRTAPPAGYPNQVDFAGRAEGHKAR